jgi:hypothetical protein
MKLLLLFVFLISLGGCASENIQKDCKVLGSGPFSTCEPYPWYKSQCNRFE